MNDFDIIRKEGRLLMEFVRGSTLYGLNIPGKSDEDHGGVYICRPTDLMGFIGYTPQTSDEKHDDTWYEIGEAVRLMLKSNPTMIEALFVPDDKIIGEIHPYMKLLRDNREKFVTKECFNPFFGYAKSQIEKARGLNKKIMNPEVERKEPMDFAYTFYRQGSTKMENWLDFRGLKQKYCGLVNIPNMHDVYGVYYDWGMHVADVDGWENDKKLLDFVITQINQDYTYDNIMDVESVEYGFAIEWLKKQKPIGYKGIVGEDGQSNELRLSSIDDKDDKPICHMAYNQSGYTKHCKAYKEYLDWVAHRNPVRYESNLDKNYDSKNMMHCFRLMHMAREIAETGEVNLVRTWDHDFLMDVRNHKFEYDEIIEMLEKEKDEMNKAMEKSTLPEKIDREFVNGLLVQIRMEQLKNLS